MGESAGEPQSEAQKNRQDMLTNTISGIYIYFFIYTIIDHLMASKTEV